MTTVDAQSRKTKIFISYSRKNKAFVQKLHEALTKADIESWVDWEGIPLSADWMAEIAAAIESADAVVFIISQYSLKSKVCNDELELGIKNNKKIVPVLYEEPVKSQEMHPVLSSLNWVYMRPKKDDFQAVIPNLIQSIQTDLGWVRQHTRLLQRANEWNSKNRNNSYLLYGTDLEEGEHWMTESTATGERKVLPLQAEYIRASRRLATNRLRGLVAGVAVALLLSIMLGIYAFAQRSVAMENEQKAKSSQMTSVANEMARATQQAIAEENRKKAEENEAAALRNENIARAQRNASEARIYQGKAGEIGTSTLLAVTAYRELPDLVEAEDILRSNISLLPDPLMNVNMGTRISKIQTSPDRTRFVTSDDSGKACVWSMEDGAKIFCIQQDGILYDSVFSRDGKYIATGSAKGQVNIWDANTGALRKTFQYNGIVWDLSAHSNGRVLGTGGTYGISLIDMQEIKEITTYQMPSEVRKLDFSKSGQYLAAGMSDGTVSIWDMINNRTMPGPKHNNQVFDVSFSPNSAWLVSSGMDSTSRAMRIGEGRQKYVVVHGDWVEYTAFGPSDDWYVTVSDDGFVRVIDTISGQERLRMAHDDFVTRARISADGQWIASTGYDHTARIWDAATGTEMMQIPVVGIGSAIEFNPSATRLVVGDRSGNITLWDISRLHQRSALSNFPEYLRQVHFTRDGARVLVNSDDRKVWAIPTGKIGITGDDRRPVITTKGLTSTFAISNDSSWLAVVEFDSEIAEYNRVILTDMGNSKKYTLTHDGVVIRAVAFTPDSKYVFTSDEGGLVKCWDVNTGLFVRSIEVPGVLLSLDVSPNGKYLAVGVEESPHISIWDLTNFTQAAKLEQNGIIDAVAFSPDGKWLATGSTEDTVYLWKAEDGSFAKLNTDFHTTSRVISLAFTPDSHLLAAGDTAGTAYVYDVDALQEVTRLRHVNRVSGLEFSADGKYLAVASQKSIHLWDVSTLTFVYKENLIDEACSRLISNFSDSKWEAVFGLEEYQPTCPNLPAGKN